jgi:hypothetical protein
MGYRLYRLFLRELESTRAQFRSDGSVRCGDARCVDASSGNTVLIVRFHMVTQNFLEPRLRDIRWSARHSPQAYLPIDTDSALDE